MNDVITEEAVVDVNDTPTVDAPLYQKYIDQMTEEQIEQLWNACAENGLIVSMEDSELGTDKLALMTLLEPVAHVDVVVACSDIVDGGIVEILMSQPITKTRPDKQRGPHTRPNGSASHPKKEKAPKGEKIPAPDDNRVIEFVQPNPKKPSSAAFQRYNFYSVGQTVAAFIKAGGTKGDVQYDLNKGFIRLKAEA